VSRYLLDTNACIALMKENAWVVARIREVGMESLLLCAPVKAELWFGACKSLRVAENQDRLHKFFNDLPSLPFDDTAAMRCGEIRATLAAQGKPIAVRTTCRLQPSPCVAISPSSLATSASSLESPVSPSRTGRCDAEPLSAAARTRVAGQAGYRGRC